MSSPEVSRILVCSHLPSVGSPWSSSPFVTTQWERCGSCSRDWLPLWTQGCLSPQQPFLYVEIILVVVAVRDTPFAIFFLSVKYKYNPPFYFSRFVGMGLKMELNFRDLCLFSLNLVLLSQVESR